MFVFSGIPHLDQAYEEHMGLMMLGCGDEALRVMVRAVKDVRVENEEQERAKRDWLEQADAMLKAGV